MAAAIQLKRSDLEPVILEKEQLGGLLNNAFLVENYPGFPEGISGPELVMRMTLHIKRLNIKVLHENVISVHFPSSPKNRKSKPQPDIQVQTENNLYITSTLVIASGTKPLLYPAALPEEIQHLVYYEVKMLDEIKGKNIVVIGSGDAAFDYSLNVSRQNNVVLINRSTDFSALPLLHKRMEQNRNITYLANRKIIAFEPLDKNKIRLEIDNGNSRTEFLTCDFLLFAIGREPDLEFISPSFKKRLDDLVSGQKVYLIGDINNGSFRQAAIATGDGIKAGMQIARIGRPPL